MSTVTLIAPPGTVSGSVLGGGGLGPYAIGADGSVTVDTSLVLQLLGQGYRFFNTANRVVYVNAPIAAELVSVVAAVTQPTNTALTLLVTGPGWPRKLQIRCVIAGSGWTAGIATIVGTDGRGNAVTEVVSLITAVTVTLKTVNAFGTITSITTSGLVGVGASDTLGVGVAADLALPGPATLLDLTLQKEVVDKADEAIGTVDKVAGTIAPTTAANGTHTFIFFYSTSGA